MCIVVSLHCCLQHVRLLDWVHRWLFTGLCRIRFVYFRVAALHIIWREIQFYKYSTLLPGTVTLILSSPTRRTPNSPSFPFINFSLRLMCPRECYTNLKHSKMIQLQIQALHYCTYYVAPYCLNKVFYLTAKSSACVLISARWGYMYFPVTGSIFRGRYCHGNHHNSCWTSAGTGWNGLKTCMCFMWNVYFMNHLIVVQCNTYVSITT